ncbi:N-acetylmuramoyl-L-alanine amidase [Pedobacter jamesrossensis]|uniref:N-acetylmuramoyl-L-alanine amidase n=1 Tax=Pedobacter jamesrossensis TaxID=1908238 RepID=A0ABV8NFC0_9SPHI
MILIYLLKVSACVAIFFATYQLLLAKLTFFKLNRTYLLFTLIVSFIIPTLTIENKHEAIVGKKPTELKVAYSHDNSFEADFNENSSALLDFSKWKEMLEYVYYAVLLGFLIKTLVTIGYIKFVLNKFKLTKVGPVVFVKAESKIKNCSFLNQIVVDSSLAKEEQDLVIQHERIHVNQAHSIDKLLVNIAVCVLWFNPIIYLWRLAIDNNHEFLADEATSVSIDKKIYASLLLNLASPVSNFPTNNFSKLPLKKRIMMMYKKPNRPMKRFIYLAILPVVCFCCVAFINQKEVITEKQISKNGEVNQQEVLPVRDESHPVLDVVKQDSISKPEETIISFTNQNNLDTIALTTNLVDEIPNNNVSIDDEIKALKTGRELILVIDAGHGGKDGAVEGVGGIKEKDLNLRAAQILKEEADKRNINVVLTRSTDKMISLRDRLPDETATAFISMHHNSMPKPNIKPPFEGIEVFVSKSNPNIKMAEKFGVSLLSALSQLSGIEVRDSLKDANLLLTRESKIPAVVLELGNISSEKSLAYVSDEQNLRRISNLILDGFVAFSKH